MPRLRLSLAIENLAPAPAFESSAEHFASVPPQAALRMTNALSALLGTSGDSARNQLPQVSAAPNGKGSGPEAPSQPLPETPRQTRDTPPVPVRRQSGPDAIKPAPTTDSITGGKGTPQVAAASSTSGIAAGAVEGDGSNAKVVGNDEFLPADDLDSDLTPTPMSPSRDTQRSTTANEPESTTPKRRWGVAPIRWGGTISAGLRQARSEGSSGAVSEVYEARLRANSYIWQPYIALVSGDFGLTTNRSRDTGGDGGAASNNLTGTSINGTGSLNVFPQSRFPFTATLSLSDSRSQGSFADSNTQYRRLGLLQNYRPANGSWSASGGYDRSEIAGDFGSDVVDRVLGNYSSSFDKHAISANATFSRSRTSDASTSDFFTSASHSYQYDEELSFSTTGSYVGQNFDTSINGHSATGNAKSMQIFSLANWTPMDSKFRGTASLRYFQTEAATSGGTSDNRIFSGTAGLNYQASRNLNLFGSVGANATNQGGTSLFESAGMTYSGDPLRFGEYDYVWSTSLSASNSSSGTVNSRTVSESANHSLMRNWQISDYSSLNASINQAVSLSQATGLGTTASTSLTHSASLSYSANAGDNLNGYLSGSLTDTRTLGDNATTFQMLNVQLTGQWRIDAYSGMESNLTWQLSRQQADNSETIIITDEFGRPRALNTSTHNQNASISGNLGYHHARFLGVRALRYRLDFRANTAKDYSRRFGNPDAPREGDRATLDLDQHLNYRIGRLDTELQYRIAEIEGARNQLLFFRVSRDFGEF
ncbi:MAG TPA: hypothetical protein VJ673_07205 [Aromatoleum sp.]|uniref:hypothetical protein n=1 Tax=Aromatoleum sp. TaxID=2307007 RepID=UPI002B49485B|nr:hypothetical protein [Aromatoleum sp.]HJV25456.1 hypothetical protein [Aromatoleum sp.]